MYYKINTFQLNITGQLWSEWKLFECPYINGAELIIEIVFHMQYQYGLEILEAQPGKPVLKSNNCLLCVNSDWTVAKLTSFNGQPEDTYKLLNALLLTYSSMHHSVEMHASLIQIGYRGIMFLGPSGIGKTTQAELWKQYRGADIINGDMVFVKQEPGYFLGCGSPWHGSSPYCLNRQVPLSALVVLKQSQENSIRRLTGFEMVSAIMNSVFLPSWYTEGYKAACDTLDALLRTVPVYELSCRPDEDAVRLTEETVFGKRII